MENLKNKIFRTIEKEIELQEFEEWLYKQNDLSERMDEDLVLELFSFNYNQKGANYEFNRKFIEYYNQEEFTNWKILANLKMLQNGCSKPERILWDFRDLSEDGYSFLNHLGYAVFDLEESEYLGWDRQKLLDIIHIEASQLLEELSDWTQKSKSKDLIEFKSKFKKSYIALPTWSEVKRRNTVKSKKWWEFWK